MIHPGQTLCLPADAAAPPRRRPHRPRLHQRRLQRQRRPPRCLPSDVFPAQGPCSFADTYGATRCGGRVHEGVDIIAKAGQWVYAVKDGTLTKQYFDAPGSLSGNGWRLTTSDGTYFFYAHLSAFAAGLAVGSAVKAGQIIGQVGMTGDAPIPHLHFEVHPGGGRPINPTPTVEGRRRVQDHGGPAAAQRHPCRPTTVPGNHGPAADWPGTDAAASHGAGTHDHHGVRPGSTPSTIQRTSTAPRARGGNRLAPIDRPRVSRTRASPASGRCRPTAQRRRRASSAAAGSGCGSARRSCRRW